LQNFDEAMADFNAVLDLDPENKAAKNQLIITSHRIKQIHNRERQTYAGMFQKFAEIDAKVCCSSSSSCTSTSPQTDTSSHCETTDTGLVHRPVCLFMPQLSLVPITTSCRGMAG